MIFEWFSPTPPVLSEEGRVKELKEIEKFYSGWSEHSKQQRAHSMVCTAVARGALVRSDVCAMCGESSSTIFGHHEDYDKPLEVIWVCPPCHSRIHSLRKYPPRIQREESAELIDRILRTDSI